MSGIMMQLLGGGAGGPAEGPNVESLFSLNSWKGVEENGTTIETGLTLGNFGLGTSTRLGGNSDYLGRDSDFSSNSDSKTFTFSAWVFRRNDSGNHYIYSADDGTYSFQVFIKNGNDIVIYGWQGSSRRLSATSSSLNLKVGWVHILISMELGNSSNRYIYVDDTDETNHFSFSNYDNDPIEFSRQYHTLGGGPGRSGDFLEGRLAHVFLDYTYRDLSTESNRRIFIDSNGGATAVSTLSALNPIMYCPLTEDYAIGKNLGTGGDFTATGRVSFAQGGVNYVSGTAESGMVWIKSRGSAVSHIINDTVRGANNFLNSSATTDNTPSSGYMTDFTANGFRVGTQSRVNNSSYFYQSWSWKKAPKFFDVITWTGNGSDNRAISHSLASVPGMIIVKKTSSQNEQNWIVWHNSLSAGEFLLLNDTNAKNTNNALFTTTQPNASNFYVGTDEAVNGNNSSYVAYLFAHNNGDGGFGITGDQDIIKCGTYQSDGSASEIDVNLGFEAQFIMAKAISTTGNWHVQNMLTGGAADGISNNPYLQWNTNDAESGDGTAGGIIPINNGFRVGLLGDINIFNATQTYAYMAIRRGPMAIPTKASNVFAVVDRFDDEIPQYKSNFITDLVLNLYTSSGTANRRIYHRLTGHKKLFTEATSAAQDDTDRKWDFNDGFLGVESDNYDGIMWSRAPNYYDQVHWNGTGANRTQGHNLGIAPEMMWIKKTSSTSNWVVWHKSLTSTTNGYILLDQDFDEQTISTAWNGTAPTDTNISLGTWTQVNQSGQRYIANLFGTVDGVSKVGTFTGNGTNQTIDCGFSSGCALFIVKRIDGTSPWLMFTDHHGIVSGNDTFWFLNDTSEKVTDSDIVDPADSGIIINYDSARYMNVSNAKYLFYAIAK